MAFASLTAIWGCSPALQDPLRAVILNGEVIVASCDEGDLLSSLTIQRAGTEVWSARALGQGVSLREPIELTALASSPDYRIAGGIPPEVATGDLITIRTSLGNYLGFAIQDSEEREELGDLTNLRC